jgi:hypothetical protein
MRINVACQQLALQHRKSLLLHSLVAILRNKRAGVLAPTVTMLSLITCRHTGCCLPCGAAHQHL